MSHTVIPDHRDGMLKLENVSNRLVHHCRIVNVRWKQPRVIPISTKTLTSDSWWDLLGDQRTGTPPMWRQPLVIGSPSTENGRFVTSATH